MGVITSSDEDKVEYYKDQAAKLRRQAEEALTSANDLVESARLQKLAAEADQEAANHQAQIIENAKKIRDSI